MENVKPVSSERKWNANDYCEEIRYRAISLTHIEIFLAGDLLPQLDGEPSATIFIRMDNDNKPNCILGINELSDGFSTEDMLSIGKMMKKIEKNYSEIHESSISRLRLLLQE